jgi:hypothetical protein
MSSELRAARDEAMGEQCTDSVTTARARSPSYVLPVELHWVLQQLHDMLLSSIEHGGGVQ